MTKRMFAIALATWLAIVSAEVGATGIAPAADLAQVHLTGPGGDDTTLAALLPDAPAIVHLWATWCAPCREELPALAQFRDALKAKVLEAQLVLVSVDTVSYERVARFLREALGLPDLVSWQETSHRAGTAFGILGYPVTIRLDAARRMTGRHRGPLDWSDPDVRRDMTSHLTGDGG